MELELDIPDDLPAVELDRGQLQQVLINLTHNAVYAIQHGGGSRIRGLTWLLEDELGLPVHLDPEPLTCVVRGAGRVLDDWKTFSGVLAS